MICTQKLCSQEATRYNTKNGSQVFALKAIQSFFLWKEDENKNENKQTNKQKKQIAP